MPPDVTSSYADWLLWCNTAAAGYIHSEFDVVAEDTTLSYVLMFDPVSHDTTLASKADLLQNAKPGL
ncbi:MAG: hypothetical protein KKE08_16985 [Gammaproteobacteria bacterium]|nr:hypothetical protein [Gammaproteobacteria bacterium]MBU2070421.1 hypothetical protein [Gammaproteobacteria bacterium]MBU2184717.1 hypothetical protein [Gammaproteobacteria bacterium]MBU2203642.1 hypothetical protein [Gammaproteobacteria bacterium]